MIRDELGDVKFCILVDEAQDESKKGQMALILRFVNNSGFLVERFFEILSVDDTTSVNLKKSISDIFVQHNIQIHNMRGQGYDGASNMRGESNELQALFLRDCPYAYYVHCFAHRLQLTLVAAAKDVPSICDLQSAQQEEITYMLAIGECESGTGANQIGTLHRPGATRWSSHYDSVRNLIDMYATTCKILGNLNDNGPNDFQVMELNCRFSETTMELLTLCSSLDPTDSFKKINVGDICKLASKFYPADFTQQEIHALRAELEHYQLDIVCNREFQQISTLSALYREMIVTKKAESYVMIQRLIRLVLTLPVSTAMAKRAFSSMKFLKTTRRNKMDDDLLYDCMILYIERQLPEKIDLESAIDEFYTLNPHRAQLK
ncbi:zinc finger MYM-type protein 1-like [Zingiber officinale]|uniref:zinc finger MYM-type protein 1-like n=1 Tax=Zingiber officinale TaxID=94328 RepID=UPI001C4C442F|nr:zinc finger MYM-type protein 1-like [Zingiber officinale]